MIREPWCIEHLKPFPAVALRLLKILANEDAEITDVCQIVKADAVFVGELLRTANSPLYGNSYTINSVERAVTALGMDHITKLAVTVALRIYLRDALRTDMAHR